MAFYSIPRYQDRLYYEPGVTKVVAPPKGNLFCGMTLDINLEIDIATSVAANIPSFQIGRAIENLKVVRNKRDIVIDLSGECLEMLFRQQNGAANILNAGLTVAVATNKQGRLILQIPFYPTDTPKPWDFLMDTRKHTYEVLIKWRNLTVVGTLFGSVGGGITALQGENFIDVTLNELDLRAGPNAKPDNLESQTPFMYSLIETNITVDQSNTKGRLDLPQPADIRDIFLFTTHEANSNQVLGVNTVLTDKISLKDTQKSQGFDLDADLVHGLTAQRWGLSALEDGVYHLPITAFGAASDVIHADSIKEYYLEAAIAKLTNNTAVRVITGQIDIQ